MKFRHRRTMCLVPSTLGEGRPDPNPRSLRRPSIPMPPHPPHAIPVCCKRFFRDSPCARLCAPQRMSLPPPSFLLPSESHIPQWRQNFRAPPSSYHSNQRPNHTTPVTEFIYHTAAGATDPNTTPKPQPPHKDRPRVWRWRAGGSGRGHPLPSSGCSRVTRAPHPRTRELDHS